jgi:hypothetical protein
VNNGVILRFDGITWTALHSLCRLGYHSWLSDNQYGKDVTNQFQLAGPNSPAKYQQQQRGPDDTYVPPPPGERVPGSTGDVCYDIDQNGYPDYVNTNENVAFVAPGQWRVTWRIYDPSWKVILETTYRATVISPGASNQPKISQGASSRPSAHPTAAASSQPTAPPPVSGDIPPSTDPGQSPSLLPTGATILGPVNLERYCQDGWGMHAVLRFPNTWGWRCSPSPVPASGERLGDQDISVADACTQQYGNNAKSHYRVYVHPSSWFCYRS